MSLSKDVLGMTLTNFRDGGANAEIRFAIGKSSLLDREACA